MEIKNFIQEFEEKKIQNTKVTPNAVGDFINEKIQFKTYLPFREKRTVIDTVLDSVCTVEDGVMKIDSIDQFIKFVTAMITAYSDLSFSDDPVADYDLLCKHTLLEPIIANFQKDYDECSTLLKMAVTDRMAENNINVLVGKFLNGILNKLDGVGEVLKEQLGNFDVNSLLGQMGINNDDLTKLKGFLDRY